MSGSRITDVQNALVNWPSTNDSAVMTTSITCTECSIPLSARPYILRKNAMDIVPNSAGSWERYASSQRWIHHTVTNSATRLIASGENSPKRMKVKSASKNGHRMLDEGAENSSGFMP